MIKKLALCTAILPILAHADMTQKMDDFFKSTTVGNYTAPHAISSQEANYLSAGSANIKTPVQLMQIARVQLPSINGGCGGINLYTGGFSFISADALAQFGKNILQDAAPVAVDLALQTWAPSIEKIKNQFQSYAQDINNFNMSSCQAAELGVGYLADSLSGEQTMEHTCKSLNASSNKFSSWLATKEHCETNADIAKAAQEAKEQHKEYSIIAPNRNVIWYILNNPSKIDSDVAQYIITLVGTVSYHGSTSEYQEFPSLFKTPDSPIVKAYLEGGDVVEYQCTSTTGADGSPNSDTGCVNMTTVKKTIKQEDSMVYKIEQVLNAVINNIKTGQELTDDQAQMLAALDDVPIFNSIRNDLSLQRITDTHRLAQVLATQILEKYIGNLMQELDQSIAGNKPGQDVLGRIQQKATQVLIALHEQSKDAEKSLTAQEQYYEALASKQGRVDDITAPNANKKRV